MVVNILAQLRKGEILAQLRKGERKFLDNKGVGAVISVIILLASLMIAAIVFSQLAAQANAIATANNDTAALNFISSTTTTGWSALNLYVIAAIVMAAGFILALLAAWGKSGSGGV